MQFEPLRKRVAAHATAVAAYEDEVDALEELDTVINALEDRVIAIGEAHSTTEGALRQRVLRSAAHREAALEAGEGELIKTVIPATVAAEAATILALDEERGEGGKPSKRKGGRDTAARRWQRLNTKADTLLELSAESGTAKLRTAGESVCEVWGRFCLAVYLFVVGGEARRE